MSGTVPSGGGGVTTSDNATITFFYGSPFTFPGPTGTAITWSLIDSLQATVIYAGQTYNPCFFQRPCAWMGNISLSMHVPQTPAPPAPGGPFSITIPGTLSIRDLSVQLYDPFLQPAGSLGGYEPAGGPASLTFQWQPGFNQWFFRDGVGETGPTVTPEPTTLLLWGTGAAGLGLARWLRRGRSHAAQTTAPEEGPAQATP